MTLKHNLILFFNKKRDDDRIGIKELGRDFDEITNYFYVTPTALQHFKRTLMDGGFLIDESPNVFRFNWEKIKKTFPEVKK